MKRLFKTFSIFCLACVLLSACSQQPPDTAPVQEPVQDGAVEEAPVYVYLTRHGQTLTNQTGRFVSGRGNTPLTEEGRKVAYAVAWGSPASSLKPPMPVRWAVPRKLRASSSPRVRHPDIWRSYLSKT